MQIYSYLTETFWLVFALLLGTIMFPKGNWDQDARLVKRLKAGNKRAFDELFEKYYKIIYSICFRIVQNQQDAEDATEEAFVTSYEKIADLKKGRKYLGWVSKIAENECNKLIGEKIHARERDNVIKSRNREDAESSLNSPSRDILPPDKLLVQKTEKEAVLKVLNELNEEERAIVELKHFQGLTFTEVARILGINEQTARTRFYRDAFRKLRERLAYLKE